MGTIVSTRGQLEAFRASHPERRTEVAGQTWRYLAGGQGRPIVFLTGGAAQGEIWFPYLTALEGEFRVLAPTYPLVATMEDLVTGVAAILDAEGLEQAHLVGSSLGGMLALCFAQRFPHRVSTLVLSNTAVLGPEWLPRLRRTTRLVRVVPAILLRVAALRRIGRLVAASPDRAFWEEWFGQQYRSRLIRRQLLSQQRCLIDFVERQRCAPLEVPISPDRVLIIESDDDQLAPAESRQTVTALFPGATVHTFHGTGHVAAIVRCDEYEGVLRQFLQRHTMRL